MGWPMDGEEDSGLPPCQAAAKDPEGSFTLAAAEGGGLDRVSATTSPLRRCVGCPLCIQPGSSAVSPALPTTGQSFWREHM